MKLVQHFDAFLNDVVNLNPTRLQLLDDNVAALKKVIRESSWPPTLKDFVPHGSWALKTIIKPVDGRPFDADLLVPVAAVEGWDAREYLCTLKALFASNATYEDKVKRYSHCVTIEYAGERRVDLAPVVVGRSVAGQLEVCNFETNAFELTEPRKYTDWLIQRNTWTRSNMLRKVTRLLKYLRDIKTTFTCPSMLLTTLLGERITATDAFNAVAFADVPTALTTIVDRLDDWLQLHVVRPTIRNPVLASEVLSTVWTDETYANFRERFHRYRKWIDEAYDAVTKELSIEKWRRVFGDEFAPGVHLDSNARSLGSAQAGLDLVGRYAQLRRAALPQDFDHVAHKHSPPWPKQHDRNLRVRVGATLHAARHGARVTAVYPDRTAPLPKRHYLKFALRTEWGIPLGDDYEIHWRVTNTGAEAALAGCLRGGFVASDDGSSRWEQLAYRGVHSVEGFVVRRRGGVLLTQSDPFYVVVE